MPIYQIIFWNEAITNSALCFFFSLSSRTWDWQWRFVEEVQLTKLFCLPTREAYFGHIPCIHQCCPSKCYAFMLFIIFFKWITINFKIIKKWCTLVTNHLTHTILTYTIKRTKNSFFDFNCCKSVFLYF